MRFFALKQELRTQKLQLEIYFQELQQLAGPTRCVVAALTIVDQPFPTIIMRQKQLEEPVVIQVSRPLEKKRAKSVWLLIFPS
jgi:hypothetical protein